MEVELLNGTGVMFILTMLIVLVVIGLLYLTIQAKRLFRRWSDHKMRKHVDFITGVMNELTRKTDYAVMSIIEEKYNRVMSVDEFDQRSIKIGFTKPGMYPNGYTCYVIGIKGDMFNYEVFRSINPVDLNYVLQNPKKFFADFNIDPIAKITGFRTKDCLKVIVEDLNENMPTREIGVEIPKQYRHGR